MICMKHLVIVESPTKAKTIRKFLGSDFIVTASMGHVRDLPSSSKDVPEELKKTSKGQLGVDVDHEFEPLYLIPKDKQKTIAELKKYLKEADVLYLATDEDREGESISWHLMEILKPKIPVHRMVFHEITKSAINEALAHPREIDEHLVRAQETRRILDRLVGYTISPVLWKKIAFGLSAGRVQSVALKAIVDRERGRMAFIRAGYWDVSATLADAQTSFEATLVATQGKRIATGKDFDEDTGTLRQGTSDTIVLTEEQAKRIAEEVQNSTLKIIDVTSKPVTRKPAPPFITSTLQQEGSRKLGLSTKETMRTAQSLYEKGFITYMRTDSTNLSEEALKTVRGFVAQRFGNEYIPNTPRRYATTAKGAQEAHEAIRPSLSFTAPDETGLHDIERDLYELIWMRTLASQMTDSQQLQTSVTAQVSGHEFRATGLRILAPGFLRAYAEGSDDAETALSDKERLLPEMRVGDTVSCDQTRPEGHETKPPARFTEAGLIQFMEKEGIGRPSTYSSVISTLIERGYVHKNGNTLIPSFVAIAVTQLMERHFGDLVDTRFTSRMEESLDRIAEGKESWLPYLQAFYTNPGGLRARIATEVTHINGEEARRIALPTLPTVNIYVGKFGAYFEGKHPRNQLTVKASIPEGVAPADFDEAMVDDILSKTQQGPTTLGTFPQTGEPMLLKTGSYGPYLQLGEESIDKKQKPKRVSIPSDIPLDTLDTTKAIALLSMPRSLGTHPETGKEIRVGLGRFGPYIVHDGDFRSLKPKEGDSIFTVTLTRALELLSQPKSGRGTAKALKAIGNHPSDNKPIQLFNGKFGPYIKYKTTSVTLPKHLTPDTITLEQAIELIDERRANKKGTKKR